MKISAVLLFAEAALAARLTHVRRDRAAKRALERLTKPKIASTIQDTTSNNDSQVEYSSNWAGAVLIGSGYTSVVGTITVPTPEVPSGGDSSEEYCASAWVGIDGDTCQTAILQTGVDFCVQDGSISFDTWYEWYPDYAYDFSLDVSAGDVVTMNVTAASASAGTAVLENETTGESVTHTFTSATTEGDLCEQNAEWIVEDFYSGDSMVPFADFGSVTFTNAEASTSSSTVDATGATILDIEQNSTVLTDCSASGSTVTCGYTG